MIKENVLNRDRTPTDFLTVDFREYAENGFLTDEGITYYQDKMMMENNHNLLFGTKNGVPVGLCENKDITGRSLNCLVIGGIETAVSYFLPNILSMRSSAIISETNVDYGEFIPFLRKNGVKVKQFDIGENKTKARFDPFRHFIKRPKKDAPNEIDREFLGEQAAVIGRKFAECFCRTTDETLKAACKEFAESVFRYVAVSPAINEEDRKFAKIADVFIEMLNSNNDELDISLIDISRLEGYGMTDCLKNLTASQLGEVINTFIWNVSLFKAEAFLEKDDTDNISIEELVNDKTYIFLDAVYLPYNSFMVSILSEYIYKYAETNLTHPKRIYQFLPNPVQFYLGWTRYEIPDFLHYITTCAPYGIGYSIATIRVDVIERMYGTKAETLYSSMGSLVIYKISEMYGLDSEMFFRWFIPFKETGPEKNSEFKNWTALSKKALKDNKVLVRIQDVPCIICDRLKLKDFIEETMPEEVS